MAARNNRKTKPDVIKDTRHIGGYFYQLSIVVLGVFVTFVGSGIITNYSE